MRWRTKVRLSATLCLVAATVAANLGQGAAADDTGPVVQLSASDAAMNDAESAARRHFDQFLSHVLTESGATMEGAAVKIAIPTGGEHAEVIWVAPFAQTSPDGFLGQFANAPQHIKDATVGDTVAFHRDQVRDWSFFGKDSKLYGSFTTRVLLPHIPRSEAAKIAMLLSDVPVPTDW